jgi:hypothetical protein
MFQNWNIFIDPVVTSCPIVPPYAPLAKQELFEKTILGLPPVCPVTLWEITLRIPIHLTHRNPHSFRHY